MNKIFNNKIYANFTFIINGRKFYANRSAFGENFTSLSGKKIEVNDNISYKEFEELMKFAYNLPMNLDVFINSHFEELYNLMNFLQIEKLMENITYFIINENILIPNNLTLPLVKIMSSSILNFEIFTKFVDLVYLNGNIELLTCVIANNPELIKVKSKSQKKNILHYILSFKNKYTDNFILSLFDIFSGILEEEDYLGATVFHYACFSSSKKIVKQFKHFDNDRVTKHGFSPLYFSILNSNYDVFVYVLSLYPHQLENIENFLNFVGQRVTSYKIFETLVSIKPNFLNQSLIDHIIKFNQSKKFLKKFYNGVKLTRKQKIKIKIRL